MEDMMLDKTRTDISFFRDANIFVKKIIECWLFIPLFLVKLFANSKAYPFIHIHIKDQVDLVFIIATFYDLNVKILLIPEKRCIQKDLWQLSNALSFQTCLRKQISFDVSFSKSNSFCSSYICVRWALVHGKEKTKQNNIY